MQHYVYMTALVRNFTTASMVANITLFTKITNVPRSYESVVTRTRKKLNAVDIF